MSAEDRKEITRLINEWNSSRYELFALSQPNERLEFHGVMRFYFQDTGEKVSTKCVRVESTATTEDVVKVLIEKFRPDMKSLSVPKDYSIYEVHSDSQERKLDRNERPLWIQLEWGKEGREGRFLLKNDNVKTFHVDPAVANEGLLRDKKRLSKREKKKLQQQEKQIQSGTQTQKIKEKEQKGKVAEHLYKEVPDSNFTRSISNPEIVMARRRQQKLENKLKQIKNKDGGGTLKVYGETLKPDIPYKTLLLSNNDTAAFAVKETLDKYGLSSEDPDNYCLVQVVTPSREDRDKHGAQIKEYILEDNALPLAILMKHPTTAGSIIFQIRRCTPDILALRKKKKQEQSTLEQQQQQQQQGMMEQKQQRMAQMVSQPNLQTQNMLAHQEANKMINTSVSSKLPFLVELTHEGFDLASPRIIQIKSDFYEVGNDKFIASTHPTNYIRIDPSIPHIEKKHCAIKKSNDNFQVLVIPYAETYVNDRIIEEPTQMFNGFTLRLGKYCLFRLENPNETVVMNGINNQMVKQNDIQSQPQNNSMVANYGLLYDSGEVTETNAQPLHSQSMSNIQQRSVKNQVMNVPALKPQVSTVSNQQSGGNSVVNGGGGESGLPGLLEFSDDSEDLLLQNICSQRIWESFRLAPVYTMYMMLRFRLSQKYKPDYSFGDKLHSLGMLIHKMVNYVREAVDQAHADKQLLPYWLANSSELLYFFKQDVHLSQQSIDAQEALAECVQIAFKYLVNLMQQQLERVLIAFFDPSDLVDDVEYDGASANVNGLQSDTINSRPTLKSVIQVLNETMYLMRSSRVNAALTIQLFSQLFHYISMSLFNRLVKDQRCTGLCSRYWGEKLSRRLSKIQVWAEKQGLELAADCHLQRIIQAAYLLQAPKHDIQQLSAISSNCFTLNSAQIKCLLKNYLLSNQEPPLSAQLCNNLIAIAQNTADDVLKQDGRMVQVEEEIDLQLPFMLPEDGHSSEMIKGLCKGFLDFLEILQNTGHCWLWQNTQGPGNWKKFFNKEQQVANNASQFVQSELPKSQSASHINQQQQQQQQQQPPVTTPTTNPTHFQSPIAANNVANQLQQVVQNAPKVIKMKLEKKNNGLGLSIVAARGSNNMTGIYIKSVVPGGAASDDGRLSAGDQLLAVDDHSLINVTQERAAELMCKSGPWVMLTVAKDAASYHNLDAILSKSPLPPPSTQSASQLPSTSMPALNQQFNGFQQPLQNISNTAQTLPRSHHLINNNAQQDAIHLPLQSSALIEQQQSGEVPTFKTRSMSQDLLRNNLVNSPIQQIQQIQPQMNQEMIQFQNQQLQRPTTITSPNSQQFQQFGYPVRSLPNEQQIRYGSERPMSIHQQQQQQQQQLPFQQQPTSQVDSRYAPPTQMAQRTLPNEFLPRFGSERPSSSNLHTQYNPPINNRLHSVNESLSPIKPQTQLRQASLSELDEINYNTNKQLMAEYQQKQQQQQQQNTNRIEDLYGKVNPNRYGNNSKSNPSLDAAVNQQYKTLPNRSANPTMNQVASNSNQLNVEEPQRAKSYGQLYEQIWSNNNGVQQQQPQIMPGQLANINQMNRQQFHSSHPSQMSLPIDEMKQLELNGVGQNRVPPPRSYQPPQQIQQQQQQQQQAMMRNYENQMVNNNNGHRAGPPVMAKPALPPNKPTQLKINREQNDEESRMEMLKKRIEMLNELEGKAYRSNEEENMLNKLRTEIEFDKRVIEMSVGQGSYGDENNEENDVEYAPEVRERIANEYFQRRKKFDEILSHSHSGSVEIVDMPSHFNGLETSASDNKLSHHHHELMMNEEADRLMEARREETRLKKHVEMSHTRSHASLSNSSSSNSYHMSAFVESEPLELQRPTLQQKHVQFMTDHGSSPSTPSRQPPPPSQLQQVTTQSFQAMKQPQQPTSSSSSSDQLDSSPSTPPPIPPLSTQPQPKRVMFSDTSKLLEFEQDHFTGGKTVDTPSVIGANEIYVDQRLKIKQQQQQQMAQMVIEGEKLSFKDKMRLFARQSGENTNGLSDSENRLKVSRKQREIESKFESK